jgi:ADP-heptose:LPS heptosyltransferase
LFRRYQLIADLQNNSVSRLVTSCLRCRKLARFDRFSPEPAGERTAGTLASLGFESIEPDYRLDFRSPDTAVQKLRASGWRDGQSIVIINPGGFFVTRNWPLAHYFEFCNLWTRQRPNSRFLLLGLESMAEKVTVFQTALGASLLNLVGETTPDEAFSLVRKASLVLSEDSGLMHMAWTNGIPTIALFGSSRSDWSRPLGPHSLLLDSSDLECCECMLPECRWGDTRCLVRRSAEPVFRTALELLDGCGRGPPDNSS